MLLGHALKRSDIPAATVSRWEADRAIPDLHTISAIARVARVDPGWLAFGEKSSAPTPLDGVPDFTRRAHLTFLALARQDLQADLRVQEIRKEQRQAIKKLRARIAALSKDRGTK